MLEGMSATGGPFQQTGGLVNTLEEPSTHTGRAFNPLRGLLNTLKDSSIC